MNTVTLKSTAIYTESEVAKVANRWVSPEGEVRFYFKELPSLAGWNVVYSKGGSLSSATKDGSPVSNNKAKSRLAGYVMSKFWYTLETGEFSLKFGDDFPDSIEELVSGAEKLING